MFSSRRLWFISTARTSSCRSDCRVVGLLAWECTSASRIDLSALSISDIVLDRKFIEAAKAGDSLRLRPGIFV